MGDYKYNYNNLKFIYKIILLIILGLILTFLVLLNSNNRVYIFLGLVFLISISIFIIQYDYAYKFYYDQDIEYKSDSNKKYEVYTEFYLTSKSKKITQVFYGSIEDAGSNNLIIYNPLIYISPNSTDLIIELRTDYYSSSLYNIFNNNPYTDYNTTEISEDNLTLDLCLENCSNENDCYGVQYNTSTCGLINDKLTNENFDKDNNNDDEDTYYLKNSYEYYDDIDVLNKISGDKIYNYNNCLIKNLPLSKLIRMTVRYDSNNIYINIKYDDKNINRVCKFDKLYNTTGKDISFDYNKNNTNIDIVKFKVNN